MLLAQLADAALFASMPRFGDMCIHAVVDLRRRFSRDALERAVAATIADFPVLGRRYEPRFWRDRWCEVLVPVSESVHVADECADIEAETKAWTRRSVAPTRERQLRVVSLPRGEGSRLVFTVTHLAVDGGGAAAVAHVLGSHLYGTRPMAAVDARRDLASALGRLRWYHAPVLARDVAGALLQPLRSLSAGRRERAYPASPGPERSVRYVTIASSDLERIRRRCNGSGASVNDVLVAALARAVAARSSAGPALVMYTMDLRRYRAAPALSAANTSAILTTVVPREALDDVASAAQSVAAVTAQHRQRLVGPAFMLVPAALTLGAPHAIVRQITRWLHPLMIDAPLRRGLLVTNVGKIDAGLAPFADDVEALRIVGPYVDGVDVPAVVAYGFRGEVHLELIAPPGVAPEALDELERELRSALEIEPPANHGARSLEPAASLAPSET